MSVDHLSFFVIHFVFLGKVFLVREIQTAEMFALKVLRKDNIIKRNQVEHTKTERSVLGYVNHPFIVGLKMAFQSKDKLYFVLDYCAGGELFFHLGKLGKFPEPRACFYAAEIVLAISYVHELGIIYRDLKPENVLLDAKGHVRSLTLVYQKKVLIIVQVALPASAGLLNTLLQKSLIDKGMGGQWTGGVLVRFCTRC
jgi:serine/threonine protein kinase